MRRTATRPAPGRPLLAAAALLLAVAASGAAQQPRRDAAPPPAAEAAAPQLVTVRPREPLRFDAQLLVPAYYDRSFWPSIRAGVELVAPAVAGGAVAPAAPRPPAAAAPPAAVRRAAPPGRAAPRGRRTPR